jgi:hypothetical protein
MIKPPETPEQPEGPTDGIINVEYTFSTSTTDPEEDQVFYKWDWGDGNFSEWLGPFDSGEIAVSSHSWGEEENYEIKVKAKDIYYVKSDWSDPLTIRIVDIPVLEIGDISGSLFKVSAVIKNNGSDATGVDWSITLDGGLILMGEKTIGRIINIPAGESVTVISNAILGFGKTTITVSAEKPEVSSDIKEQDAFILLFFIKI